MEQIRRIDGVLYYGEKRCGDADEAYGLFRADYNRSLGKNFYDRLGRLGARKDRVRDGGDFFRTVPVYSGRFRKRVPVRLLGIVSGAYCKILGGWDFPDDMPEKDFYGWLAGAFVKGSGRIRLVGTRLKSGRTAKNQRKRFR